MAVAAAAVVAVVVVVSKLSFCFFSSFLHSNLVPNEKPSQELQYQTKEEIQHLNLHFQSKKESTTKKTNY